jgi:hypothetical protein
MSNLFISVDFFKEREAARKLYKTKSGEKAKKKQKGANTFVPGGELVKQQQTPRITKKDADAIKVFVELKSFLNKYD